MAIVGDDPMLLAEQDPEKVSRAGKANAMAYKPALDHIANFHINWSIVSYPSLSWARRMFPDLGDDAAVAKLADAIFAASRVTGDDPVAEWQAHNATLRARTEWLNAQRFAALACARGSDLPGRGFFELAMQIGDPVAHDSAAIAAYRAQVMAAHRGQAA
jgi:aminopeptidase